MTHHKRYYCYKKAGEIKIVDKEPAGFRQLPCNFIATVPTEHIASLAYQTELKLRQLRESK